MHCVCQQTVLRMLTQEQNDDCMRISGEFINAADSDKVLLQMIITGKNTWCFLYSSQSE